MSTALMPRPGGWASLLSLFLFLDLATCQTGTWKLTSTPANYVGFFIAPPSVKTITCASTETWYSLSGYARCCLSTPCSLYTVCNSGTYTRMDGFVSTCPSSMPKCVHQTIYPSSGTSYATSWRWLGCASEAYSISTVYRELVLTAAAAAAPTLTANVATVTTSPSPGSKLSPTTLQTSQQPGANPGKGTDPSQPTSTAPPAAGATDSGSSPSKAMVAGAVVGPLVAIAGALAFLFFWLRKRRGDKDASDAAAGATEPLQSEQQDAAAAAAAGKHASMIYPTSPGPPAYDPSVAKQPEMSVYYQNVAGYPPQSPPQSPPPQSPQSPQQQGYYPSQSPPPQGYYPSQSPPPQGYYPPQSPPPQSVHELAPTQPATMHELGPGQVPPPVHELDPTQVPPRAHELDPTQVPPRAHELGPGQVAPQELAGS